jgi:NADH-quinone oxidoreductase subunit L
VSTFLLAAEVATGPSQTSAANWFLENAWLIPLLPALSFLGILLFGKRLPRKGSEIGIAAVAVAFVLATITAIAWIDHRDNFEVDGHEEAAVVVVDEESSAHDEVALTAEGAQDSEGDEGHGEEADEGDEGHGEEAHPSVAVHKTVQWLSSGGVEYDAGILVDGPSVMMLFMVTLVSLLIQIYSTDYVSGDSRYTHFFAFLSLFTAAMLFFVLSDNILQMIVGWELVGVCSFVLIGHWWEDKANSDAALKAFITNRVGDIGLLVGMITLYFSAGQTFDTITINERIVAGEVSHTALLVASLCLLAAVMSKSGQFILHTWLPDAMAGPTPVSALIHAATMVVAGIFMVARLYPVFYEGMQIDGASINMLALVGSVTLLFGGLLAFTQNDIKKVLAYSTISQLGYMVMALGVGAWTAAMFHLFTHAFFKACLFLGSGSVSHAVHSFDMKTDMGGLRKPMPHTFVTFLISSIALMGLPPLAGFWSKDEILAGTGGWGLFGGTGGTGAYTLMLIMGMLGAAVTAAYMTRVIYLTFFGEFRGHGEPHESGPRIIVPLYILAGFAVLAGLLNMPVRFQLSPDAWEERFGHFVEPVAPYFPAISHATPSWTLAVLSTLVALAGAGLAYWYYFVRVERRAAETGEKLTEIPDGPVATNALARAGHTVLVNKYYFDHLYTDIIAAGTKGPVADAAYWTNQNIIDKVVDTAGEGSVKAGQAVYDYIDQGVVDGIINGSGKVSELSGEELRHIQTGKVQQYAALLFAAATVLAGVFIVYLSL